MSRNNQQALSTVIPFFLASTTARTHQAQLTLFTPKRGRIFLSAEEKSGNLIVEVQGTGSEITEEEPQRLFQPYYRVESDRQRFSGLGLGVALCKTPVELHGGQIWVESRVGEGSTFSFSVPLEAASQQAESVNRQR